MGRVKFDVNIPNQNFAQARVFAERADRLGFHSISLDDHFFMRGLMSEPSSPHLECYTTLSALAPLTRNVRLVQMVTSMSYRNPALLAKMTATLDNISDGRLTVGVGAGWYREEYAAYGYPYPSNAERIAALGEGVKILKKMWTEDEPSFHGRYYSIDKAWNFPKPVQKPHPPLLIGGSGNQVLRISAAEANIANLIPPIRRGEVDLADALRFDKAELGRRIARLRGYAREAGRDPASIEISGTCFALIASTRAEAEAMRQSMAAAVGLSDPTQADESPQVLSGTVEEVIDEIRWRVDQLGVTYFVLSFLAIEALELFAAKVMPSFV